MAQATMVDLVKGLCKVQNDDVRLIALFRGLKELFVNLKQLCLI